MSAYNYPQSKVIDEVTFKESAGGHNYAYIHAAPGADPQTIDDIKSALTARKWQVTPYSIGSKPLLQVSGFESEKKLDGLLRQSGWAQGKSQYTETKKEKLTWREWINGHKLGITGLFYGVGDAAFTRYGYAGNSRLNTAAGAMYGAGTLSLAVGGRKDPSDIQIRDIAKMMAKHARELKIDLPKNCSLTAITEDYNKGLLQKADELWRRYPSELMNLFFAIGGACIATEAYISRSHVFKLNDVGVQQVYQRLSKKNPSITQSTVLQKMQVSHKRESWLDMGLGIITAITGLFTIAVKEKARDPDDPPAHGLAAIWEWIRERPLAISGVGYMAATLCHAASTTLAWNLADNKRRKAVPFRVIFVAMNLLAEAVLMISSKGHGEGVVSDTSVDDTAMSLAADLIVKQPRAMQNALIDYMGNFLGRQDVLALGNEEAISALRQQVEAMRNNPWAQAQDTKSTELAVPALVKPETSAWQAKQLARDAAAAASPQPSI